MHKPGRNDPCPCGSGKKFKKCCTLTILRSKTLIQWLKEHDLNPPIDYDTITREEMDDFDSLKILVDRCEEIYAAEKFQKAREKAEEFQETGHI